MGGRSEPISRWLQALSPRHVWRGGVLPGYLPTDLRLSPTRKDSPGGGSSTRTTGPFRWGLFGGVGPESPGAGAWAVLGPLG
jgi:hypothetical protein